MKGAPGEVEGVLSQPRHVGAGGEGGQVAGVLLYIVEVRQMWGCCKDPCLFSRGIFLVPLNRAQLGGS